MDSKNSRFVPFSEPSKNAYIDPTVTPHWLPGDNRNAFWYRKPASSSSDAGGRDLFTFVYVDAENAVERPAFDHESLAKALKEQDVAEKAEADGFPFRWIDLSDDGVVRFRSWNGRWQWHDTTKTLSRYDGEINDRGGPLKPFSTEKPVSEESDDPVVITFVNKTKEKLDLFWIDWEGQANYYDTVGVGLESRRETYRGHVWRVAGSKKKEEEEGEEEGSASEKEARVLFMAPMESEDESFTVFVEEDMFTTEADGNERPASEDQEGPPQQLPHGATPLWKVFIRNCDVWIRASGTQIESPLSTFGTSESPFSVSSISHSPADSGRFVVVHQYTPEQEHLVYHIESSPKDQVQPKIHSFQYLKPGDRVTVYRPRMFDCVEKKEVETSDGLFTNPYEITGIGWSRDGKEYRFIHNQRGHQVLRVVGMSVTGTVRTIIEEKSDTFIDYSSKLYHHLVKDSSNSTSSSSSDDDEEIIWASERDGYNSLYLYSLTTASVKHKITHAPMIVRSVSRVDDVKRQIWIRAFGVVDGQDPYYAHLVRINFDGTGFTVLSEGDGTHSWTWSPSRKYLIDTWSRVDMAPVIVLRDGETGRQLLALEDGQQSLDHLVATTGWTPPIRLAFPGRDSHTPIHGILILPRTFSPSNSYPVIEHIYAGPHSFHVPASFTLLDLQHTLADAGDGFIVAMIDGMGTNWRSKPFHDVCHKNLRDAGFPDRIAWLRGAQADGRPWMDLARGVGIVGGSAGGQNALAALLWHGEFYRVAVSDCGCHDNRMDKLWWNEQWMGWPVGKEYEESSNVVNAGRLDVEGGGGQRVMLIVGELDRNVDPASTMQVVDKLNRERKMLGYELLCMLGEGHGCGMNSEGARKRWIDFFIRHLISNKE